MDYDIIVVGAGPAGSTTARFAAENNASVLMIEKRQEIGSPVRCGEGISRAFLDEIGIKPDNRWIANQVKGARIFSPNERVLYLAEEIAGNEVGYVIERDEFDRELAKMACEKGAELMIKTSAVGLIIEQGKVKGIRARHFGREMEIEAKIVIGADGFESQVGRWAGIDTKLSARDIISCLQYRMVNIECDKDYNDFYLGSCAPGGYIWVFPKSDDEANVGIGVQLTKIKERGAPKKLLEKFIEKHKEIAKGTQIEIVAGAVSVCQPIKSTVGNGIMLVGDAARMIDPITGGGIANGCIAGKICGEVAGKAVKENDVSKERLIEYERRWREKLEDKLYRNWVAKEKLSKLDDDSLNKIVESLSDVKLERIGTLEILQAVQKKYPELVKEFEGLI